MLRRTVSALALSTLLVSCGGDGGTGPAVSSVTLSTSAQTLTEIGATVQLSATAWDEGGAPAGGVEFTWSSSATSVATVSSAGLVTAVADGSATITTRAEGGASAAATITVAQRAAAVSVDADGDTVAIGSSVQVNASATDGGGTALPSPTFAWVSSDPGVAAVDANGLVTGVTSGEVVVTATLDGAVDQAELVVVRPDLTPQADTVLAGLVEVKSLDIPEGVTVTAASDLVLDVLESATVAGVITGECVAIGMVVRGDLSLTGSVTNGCAELVDAAGPGVTLSVLGNAVLDGALIESGGAVFVRGDTVTSLEDAVSPPAGASRSAAAGGRDSHLTILNVTVRARPDEMPAGADGGAVGGPGIDAPDHAFIKDGLVGVIGSSFTTARGGRGGNAAADDDTELVKATGGKGGHGGQIVIRGSSETSFSTAEGQVHASPGPGGWGGNATAVARPNPDLPTAPRAEADGGAGGAPGGFQVPRSAFVTLSHLRMTVWSGARGGSAEARGADGVNASADRDAQPGGSATARGGFGAAATFMVLGVGTPITPWRSDDHFIGIGGTATAVAGNGGGGITPRPNGAKGGDAEARARDSVGPPGAAPDLARGDIMGPSASATDGNGGLGADVCFPPVDRSLTGLIRVLVNGGNSDQFLFNAGAAGIAFALLAREQQAAPGGNGGEGGTLEAVSGEGHFEHGSSTLGPGGNGGDGGDGTGPGAGGAGGEFVPSSRGDVLFVNDLGKAGEAGNACPAPGVVANATGGDLPGALPPGLTLRVGARSADGTSAITLSGAFPWVEVTGTIAEDGAITAEGRGTVAGAPNILNTFVGTLDAATGALDGQYSMDTEKAIDPGHPVVYGVEMTEQGGSAAAGSR